MFLIQNSAILIYDRLGAYGKGMTYSKGNGKLYCTVLSL